MQEKFYNESLYWILLSSNRKKIISQIPEMHYQPRKIDIQTSLLLFWSVADASVQPADSTPARLSLQMEAQQKKLELENGRLTGIIFLISGRIMIFFHILGE